MRFLRKLAVLTTSLGLGLSTVVTPGFITAQSAAAGDAVLSSVWTADSYQNVFAADLAPAGATTAVNLVAARNEYESAQIMVRKTRGFRIQGVDFTDLTGAGGASIRAAELDYRFEEFEHLPANSTFAGSQPITNPVRKAPGDFPDALSNEPSMDVPANSTQPIRVRLHVPKATAPGTYRGTARLRTDQGVSSVPVAVKVENVTVPDASKSSFTTDLWMLQYGALSWDEGAGDTIELFYGYKRLSPQWWKLMGEFARSMRENRHNNLPVNVVQLLIGGGSSLKADGTYTFDWKLFDQFVSFFHDRGVVKQLEGFWMAGPNVRGNPYPQVEIIDRDAGGTAVRSYAAWDGAKSNNFIDQFVPALHKHLEAKGWADEWWMHVGDEPNGADNLRMHAGLTKKYRSLWPGVRLSDAVFDWGGAQAVSPTQSFLIPNEMTINEHEDFYAAQRAAGKEVWLYNCNIPTYSYLNRFIDQPVWNQRSTMWYAYSRNLSGYLHWAFNSWQYQMADQEVRGDGWIVKPDKKNNKLKYTLRLESLRDGLEDRDLLEIVGKRDPSLAKSIAGSLVTTANRYSRDTGYLARMRTLLVRAAAGDDLPDLAKDLAEKSWRSAGDEQAVQADLGSQAQIDAVQLHWGAASASTYRIEISYDRSHWAVGYQTTSGDGGTDFVGLNAKGRYVRVVRPGGDKAAPPGLQVIGQRLDRPNLAGGKTYTKSVKPVDGYPDNADRESTDGLPAGHFGDGRSYAYTVEPGTTKTFDVTVDLGIVQPLDQVKVHRYEEFDRAQYGSDAITISVSPDGTAYRQKARLGAPNGADGVWYDATFPVTQARFIKVSHTKKYGATSDMVFLDEVEAYGPSDPGMVNVAEGKRYTKSAEPDDPFYLDADGKESTDGEIGGDFTDGKGYAYYIGAGQSRTVSATVELDGPKAVSEVMLQKYEDRFHHYEPDRVTVYIKPVGGDFRPVGQAAWATSGWYDMSFDEQVVTAVRVDVTKRDARFADYLFLDEIAVIGDLSRSPVNLAAGQAYTRTTDHLDPNYPDSTARESTDGVLAGHYSDGKSWAYVLAPGETVTSDIDFDLGKSRMLSVARFREYNDGGHNYRPDKVTLLVSDDGKTFTEKATSTQPSGRWFEGVLGDVSARYVRFRAVKTYGSFADYLFVDELEIYGR
jgi:hypothetical protein